MMFPYSRMSGSATDWMVDLISYRPSCRYAICFGVFLTLTLACLSVCALTSTKELLLNRLLGCVVISSVHIIPTSLLMKIRREVPIHRTAAELVERYGLDHVLSRRLVGLSLKAYHLCWRWGALYLCGCVCVRLCVCIVGLYSFNQKKDGQTYRDSTTKLYKFCNNNWIQNREAKVLEHYGSWWEVSWGFLWGIM